MRSSTGGRPSPAARGSGWPAACLRASTERLVGDPARLRQVLTNLVDNAVAFTDAGEVVLEAHLLGETEGASTLRLAVRDTGIGIPRQEHVAVFEMFTQAGDGTDGRHGRAGLGRSICRRLVHLMGGRVGLESEPGSGSAF